MVSPLMEAAVGLAAYAAFLNSGATGMVIAVVHVQKRW